MKKIIYFFWLSIFTLTSCSFDENNEPYINAFGWFIIVGFVILIIVAIIAGSKQNKEFQAYLKKEGLQSDDFIQSGDYVGGHPDLDKNILKTTLLVRDEIVNICEGGFLRVPQFRAKIPTNSIKDIEVDDSSSIENKITLGRVFLVGIFALAWRKKKRNELAFVTINWNDGKFNHTTIFNFEGKNAMTNANTCRNKIIRKLKT